MEKLVSIIIPCYNAQEWLAETIDSCLQQTYSQVEVIVIDDGSTDGSIQILQQYGDRIRWEQQPYNQGANAARNRAFALARGAYIQWLDADDLILPEKIERQVQFLEETGNDAVYGDWQAKYHAADGSTRMSRVMEPGAQADILASLLADWWTAVASLLYRRDALERAPGWDDRLLNGDDRHYMLALAMSGARISYQPGCYSIYRRHSSSITGSRPMQWIQGQVLVVDNAKEKLIAKNRLTPAYRQAIATSYFKLSRHAFRLDTKLHAQLLQKALAVVPDFKSVNEPSLYKMVQNVIGFRRTEHLVGMYRLLRKRPVLSDEW